MSPRPPGCDDAGGVPADGEKYGHNDPVPVRDCGEAVFGVAACGDDQVICRKNRYDIEEVEAVFFKRLEPFCFVPREQSCHLTPLKSTL